MSKNAIVYIDFGGTHISAIAGTVMENHALKILGEQTLESDDVKSGVVEKITGAAYKVNQLTTFLRNSLKWKEKVTLASVSVNAKSMKNHTYTIEKRIPNVISEKFLEELKQECRRNIKTENVVVFDVIPLAYYVDGESVEDPVGKKGFQLRVDYNMIIGHYLVRETLERTIERTGISVDYIHLGVEAIATAVLDDNDKADGCALINFGATTTTLGVYFEGKLQELLVVPLGGLNITKDILELGISYTNAELLKCKIGYAMEKFVTKPVNVQIPHTDPNEQPVKISTAFLAMIIEARLEEMLTPILNQLNSIPYPLHKGIVISGGASKLKFLTEFLVEKTGSTVRIGNHADWLSEDTDEKFFDPKYAQAVGSILLTNDLIECQIEHQTTIQSKLPSKLIRSIAKGMNKISDKYNDGMGTLFKYDEMEREIYEENEQSPNS